MGGKPTSLPSQTVSDSLPTPRCKRKVLAWSARWPDTAAVGSMLGVLFEQSV